jgi:sulfoxide reductase heme-binding subunit YedZ
MIGPLNVLRGAPNPLSTYLRRDFGIIAGVLSLVHTFVGLQVHMRGDFIQYFFYRTPVRIETMRFDVFGIANYLGLIAALIFLVLLCSSNNISIRRLGPTGWKKIQKWNYIGAVLLVLHGLLYQLIEQRMFAFVAYVLGVAAIVAIVQLLGFRRRSEQMARPPGSLAGNVKEPVELQHPATQSLHPSELLHCGTRRARHSGEISQRNWRENTQHTPLASYIFHFDWPRKYRGQRTNSRDPQRLTCSEGIADLRGRHSGPSVRRRH